MHKSSRKEADWNLNEKNDPKGKVGVSLTPQEGRFNQNSPQEDRKGLVVRDLKSLQRDELDKGSKGRKNLVIISTKRRKTGVYFSQVSVKSSERDHHKVLRLQRVLARNTLRQPLSRLLPVSTVTTLVRRIVVKSTGLSSPASRSKPPQRSW